MSPPAQKFVDGLAALGVEAQAVDGVVEYEVTPVEGAYAGTSVRTGVAVSELNRWPHAPPHWIHLPQAITFTRTNMQASPRVGWVMHSRSIRGWGTDRNSAQAWIGHVRAVVGGATS